MDDSIQQLRQQSSEHYEAVKELRTGLNALKNTVVGNGNKTGSLQWRLEKLEGDMGEFHDYLTREKALRAERQVQVDKRDEKRDRKLNVLVAIVAVVGVLIPTITLFADKLL